MATAKQLRFVAEYLKDRNASASYQRAGFKATGNAAESAACRLLRDPEIKELVDAGETKLIQRLEMDQETVARLLWDIATADANDLIQYRRLCCRYCYGAGFRYQRTTGEREIAFAEWEAEQREADDDDPVKPFDEKGGIGFHKLKAPNPECPECFGEGVEDVYVPDTRLLTGAAKIAYAGVKVTREGIEVKMHPRYEALIKAGDRLKLKERAAAVIQMHRSWKPIATGYKKTGHEQDIEYLEEAQNAENYRFPVISLAEHGPKEPRIERLAPDLEAGRWWFPPTLWRTGSDGVARNIIEQFIEEEYKPLRARSGQGREPCADRRDHGIAAEGNARALCGLYAIQPRVSAHEQAARRAVDDVTGDGGRSREGQDGSRAPHAREQRHVHGPVARQAGH